MISHELIQEAQQAREQTNGYKLDRSHVFVVNMFDDFEKYMRVPDEWNPPEIKPYTPGVYFFNSLCFLFFGIHLKHSALCVVRAMLH